MNMQLYTHVIQQTTTYVIYQPIKILEGGLPILNKKNNSNHSCFSLDLYANPDYVTAGTQAHFCYVV